MTLMMVNSIQSSNLHSDHSNHYLHHHPQHHPQHQHQHHHHDQHHLQPLSNQHANHLNPISNPATQQQHQQQHQQHQQHQQQQQQPSNTNKSSTSTSTSTSSRSRDAAKADAFANLVVFIWFSSFPSLLFQGSSTPSTKSPTSSFQPLHSSPLRNSSQNINRFQSQSQRPSLPDPSSTSTSGLQRSGMSFQQSASGLPHSVDEPDAFANGVRRALEEHLISSSNQSASSGSSEMGGNQIPHSSSTSPELPSLDSDPTTSTQRLIPHQRFRTFARDVLMTTQASGPGMALALLFIFRLKSNHPQLKGKEGSEFRIAITALMLSNKALEDHTFTNKSWSEISGIDLKDVNKMETEFWLGLGMNINASVEEYHHWLATLRSLEERRALALIKRDRDLNRRKQAQHHAAIAALHQQQQQQQQQYYQSISLQSSPQHPHHNFAHDQPFGYPTPPLAHHAPRPGSSSGLQQTHSYPLQHPSQLSTRNLGSGSLLAPHQMPNPSTSATPPFSNFSLNSRSNHDDAPTSTSLATYQLPPVSQFQAGSGLVSGSSSRFNSPEISISSRHPLHPHSSHTPLNDSRRLSSASSQGSNSVSGVKRAFNAMQTGSVSPFPHKEEEEQGSGTSNKRSTAGLGLLRTRNLGGEEWESSRDIIGGGDYSLGSNSDGGGRSARSSVSPTAEIRGHSRQASFPLDQKFTSASQGHSQLQSAQYPPSQKSNARNLGCYQQPSSPCPPNNSFNTHIERRQSQNLNSNGTPNILVKPYDDYDLNSRPQPTELAFLKISAGQDSKRRIFETQPAPPLTELEIANSRRGSFQNGIGFRTPNLPSSYVFSSTTSSNQSPNFNFNFYGLGGGGGHTTTPMGNHFDSQYSIYNSSINAPQLSPIENQNQIQNPYSRNHSISYFHPQLQGQSYSHQPYSLPLPHPLSRKTPSPTTSISPTQSSISSTNLPLNQQQKNENEINTFSQGYHWNSNQNQSDSVQDQVQESKEK